MNKELAEERLKIIVDILQSDRLTAADMGRDGGVLTDIDNAQLLSLNKTGMYLVRMMNDPLITIEKLVENLSNDFNIKRNKARDDIQEFIEAIFNYLNVAN